MPRRVVSRSELDDAVRGLQAAYKLIRKWPLKLFIPKRVRKYVKAAVEVLTALRPVVR